MKIRIDIFRLAVAALAAAVIVYGLSCSSGNGKATPLLETADSLMASDPQAARQVLSSVADGKDIRMSRAERAYYLLLVAESDYLCGEPMIRGIRLCMRWWSSSGAELRKGFAPVLC